MSTESQLASIKEVLEAILKQMKKMDERLAEIETVMGYVGTYVTKK
jgi:hypothetical protein